MDNKESSYQKIKRQRDSLLKDIRILVLYPDSYDADLIKGFVKADFKIEETIMFGSDNIPLADTTKGISQFISETFNDIANGRD